MASNWGYDYEDPYRMERALIAERVGNSVNKYDLEARKGDISAGLISDIGNIAGGAISQYGQQRALLQEQMRKEAQFQAAQGAQSLEKVADTYGKDSPEYKAVKSAFGYEGAAPTQPTGTWAKLKKKFLGPSAEDYKASVGKDEFSRLEAGIVENPEALARNAAKRQMQAKLDAMSSPLPADMEGPQLPQQNALIDYGKVMENPLEKAQYEKTVLGQVTEPTLYEVKRWQDQELFNVDKERRALAMTEAEAQREKDFTEGYAPQDFAPGKYDLAKAQYMNTGKFDDALTAYTASRRELEGRLTNAQIRAAEYRGTQHDTSASDYEKDAKKSVADIDKSIRSLQQKALVEPDSVNAEGVQQAIAALQNEKNVIKAQTFVNTMTPFKGAEVVDVLANGKIVLSNGAGEEVVLNQKTGKLEPRISVPGSTPGEVDMSTSRDFWTNPLDLAGESLRNFSTPSGGSPFLMNLGEAAGGTPSTQGGNGPVYLPNLTAKPQSLVAHDAILTAAKSGTATPQQIEAAYQSGLITQAEYLAAANAVRR